MKRLYYCLASKSLGKFKDNAMTDSFIYDTKPLTFDELEKEWKLERKI